MRIWEKHKHILVGERSSNELLNDEETHQMTKTVSCDGQFFIMDTVIQSRCFKKMWKALYKLTFDMKVLCKTAYIN